MGKEELLKDKREEILRLAAKHGAYNVRVFGSVARGESDADSDIDFLVEMGQDRSLMSRAGLVLELEELLGCKVDVATERTLRIGIRDSVLRDSLPI